MMKNGDRLIKKIQILEVYGKRLKEYETIGTIKECREARERQKQKKPKIINEGISTCPICGAKVLRCYDFCKDCGQAIDWSK